MSQYINNNNSNNNYLTPLNKLKTNIDSLLNNNQDINFMNNFYMNNFNNIKNNANNQYYLNK